MTILLFLTFFAGVVFYLVSVKERSLSVGAYVLGLFLGVVSVIISKFISFDGLMVSPDFWTHSFRFFLRYFLLPAVISLPIFFLISFSLSEETLEASPANLLGVFTVMFIMTMFHFRAVPNFGMFILLAMLYVGTVFLFYALLQLCFSVLSFMPQIGSFFIAFFAFLLVCFLSSTVLSSWYFSFSQMTYLVISACVLAAGVVATYILGHQGNLS